MICASEFPYDVRRGRLSRRRVDRELIALGLDGRKLQVPGDERADRRGLSQWNM